MDDTLLRQAIRDRRVIEFRYHGEHRTVEPYRLGLDGGRLRLMGWQARKGWRSFYAHEMLDLELTERTFLDPREGYTRGDPRMDRILAEV
ncbi:WYL domain-containing protein [Rubellimicrobium rubrum]|uniref:WYL domain-containing protein n=1 Tax=Rubellimicrobium rubrum TaxID=2585369 RepID=A0A5C4MVR7_9RHOB|nr:WYL domain-containing protein [Rubellimicrobium rubrum]TNC50156.1 WYL domain-containing protein [Rubellimicrobium rubrum]